MVGKNHTKIKRNMAQNLIGEKNSMDLSEIKRILRGKWEFNINQNKLICKQKETHYIFINKNNEVFQQIISLLTTKGIPNPELQKNIPQPKIEVPLETFHRVMRASMSVYDSMIEICETPQGLICKSEHIRFKLNDYKYSEPTKSVRIDPQIVYTVSRSFRTRERILTRIKLTENEAIMELEFPWVNLILTVPNTPK